MDQKHRTCSPGDVCLAIARRQLGGRKFASAVRCATLAIDDPQRLPIELAGAHLVRSHAWLGLLDLRSATEDLAQALRLRGASAVAESHRQSTAELQKRLFAAAQSHRQHAGSHRRGSRVELPTLSSSQTNAGKQADAAAKKLMRKGCDPGCTDWVHPQHQARKKRGNGMAELMSEDGMLELPVITNSEVRVELDALAKEQTALRPRSVARMQLALARALCSSGEWQTAEHTLCAALEFEPLDWRLYFLRAACRTHMRRLDLALDDTSAAIVLRPMEAELYLMRARLYGALGARRREEEQMERLTELAPTHRAVDEARAARRKAAMDGFRTALSATAVASSLDSEPKQYDQSAATSVGAARTTIVSGLMRSTAREHGRSKSGRASKQHLLPLHTSGSVANALRSLAQKASGSTQSRVVGLCIAAALSRVCDGDITTALREVCQAAAVFAGERLQLPLPVLAALAADTTYSSKEEQAERRVMLRKQLKQCLRNTFTRIDGDATSDVIGIHASAAGETDDEDADEGRHESGQTADAATVGIVPSVDADPSKSSTWESSLVVTVSQGSKIAQQSLDLVAKTWARSAGSIDSGLARAGRQQAEEAHEISTTPVSVLRARTSTVSGGSSGDSQTQGLSALGQLYDSKARRQSIGAAQALQQRLWAGRRALHVLLAIPSHVIVQGLKGVLPECARRNDHEDDLPMQMHEWISFCCSPSCLTDRSQTARQIKAHGRSEWLAAPELPVMTRVGATAVGGSVADIGVRVPSDVLSQYDRCMLSLASQAIQDRAPLEAFRCSWVALRNEMAIRECVDPGASVRSFPCLEATEFGDFWMGVLLRSTRAEVRIDGKVLPLLPLEGDVHAASKCVTVVEGVQAALSARAGMSLEDIHVLHGCPSRLNGARVDPQYVVSLADSALQLGRLDAAGMVLVHALLDGTLPSRGFVPFPDPDGVVGIGRADESTPGAASQVPCNYYHVPCPVLQVQLVFAKWLEQLGSGASRKSTKPNKQALTILQNARLSPKDAMLRACEIAGSIATGSMPVEAGYDLSSSDTMTPQLELAALTLQTSSLIGLATLLSREGLSASHETAVASAEKAVVVAKELESSAKQLLAENQISRNAAMQASASSAHGQKLAWSIVGDCQQKLAGGTTHTVRPDTATASSPGDLPGSHGGNGMASPARAMAQPDSTKPEDPLARVVRLTAAAEAKSMSPSRSSAMPRMLVGQTSMVQSFLADGSTAIDHTVRQIDVNAWSTLPHHSTASKLPVLHDNSPFIVDSRGEGRSTGTQSNRIATPSRPASRLMATSLQTHGRKRLDVLSLAEVGPLPSPICDSPSPSPSPFLASETPGGDGADGGVYSSSFRFRSSESGIIKLRSQHLEWNHQDVSSPVSVGMTGSGVGGSTQAPFDL